MEPKRLLNNNFFGQFCCCSMLFLFRSFDGFSCLSLWHIPTALFLPSLICTCTWCDEMLLFSQFCVSVMRVCNRSQAHMPTKWWLYSYIYTFVCLFFFTRRACLMNCKWQRCMWQLIVLESFKCGGVSAWIEKDCVCGFCNLKIINKAWQCSFARLMHCCVLVWWDRRHYCNGLQAVYVW